MAPPTLDRLCDDLRRTLTQQVSSFPEEPTERDFVKPLAGIRVLKQLATRLIELEQQGPHTAAQRTRILDAFSTIVQEMAR